MNEIIPLLQSSSVKLIAEDRVIAWDYKNRKFVDENNLREMLEREAKNLRSTLIDTDKMEVDQFCSAFVCYAMVYHQSRRKSHAALHLGYS
jgi:hypothetical protein